MQCVVSYAAASLFLARATMHETDARAKIVYVAGGVTSIEVASGSRNSLEHRVSIASNTPLFLPPYQTATMENDIAPKFAPFLGMVSAMSPHRDHEHS